MFKAPLAAELTEGEHRRLSRLVVGRQRPAQGGARVAGQAETEHQGGQLVEVNSDGGPRGAAGIGGWLRGERQAGQRADRGQHQRAGRASVVQGVRIAAALGGEPPDGHAGRGKPPEHRRDLGEEQSRLIRFGGETAHYAGRV